MLPAVLISGVHVMCLVPLCLLDHPILEAAVILRGSLFVERLDVAVLWRAVDAHVLETNYLLKWFGAMW